MKTEALLRRELAVLERDLGVYSPLLNNFLRIQTRNCLYLVNKNSLIGLKKLQKKVNYQDRIESRSTLVFDTVKQHLVDSGMLAKTVNEGTRIIESELKIKKISDLLAPKRNYSAFVVCDVHDDCASDHLNYQGKVYYKDGWENFVEDDGLRAKIQAYINNHGCLSIKQVTTQKPYLITRPYCRHNLVEIPTEEVLSSSVRKIIEKHRLFRKGVMIKTQADRASRAYLDRLRIYNELWKVAPNKKLGEDINKTRKLYKKWRNQAKN